MNVPYRILFVCMGNICRSPIAEAVTRTMAQRQGLAAMLQLDSAGTHGHYHAGEAPDVRARRIAAKRGYDLSRLRARPVIDADFDRFDRILGMDESNFFALQRQCPEEHRVKLGYFLDYAPALGINEIPDPYYGADSGFERVLDLCELAATGLLADYMRRRASS
ncbi:MAG: low molecular weight phosphotyrosine protein phosphatase [Candidatus Accumulibacter sp.]|uniref:low molecular weight protein-tyrosine-phosphatase n=1 Tax=Accumulibacter sp. TaxID=2053492 RepID=UPI002585B470|nr:low molecular weight protein-tyrosine-phosphatase [Accumulibacter sp.]MCM8622294.1 low molecular weight phosphotyrosine protein phosphatase [Accumulibacter sp.]